MIAVAGGDFLMGSDSDYPEEAPKRRQSVAPFLIDRCAVTNAEFGAFVSATGYKTTAETPLDPGSGPAMPAEYYAPGSLVFAMTDGPIDLRDFRNWWRFVPGADWKHPEGPESTLIGREDHPVVHVSLFDARAYADWAEKSIPSEVEWEFAAKGGSDTRFPWGDDLSPNGETRANTWRGKFPFENERTNSAPFTVPTTAFEPNGYGLFNVIGNVWEWTTDKYGPGGVPAPCCLPQGEPEEGVHYVAKGGSFLCSPSYCRRYRPSARSPQEARSSSSNLGFRCVRR